MPRKSVVVAVILHHAPLTPVEKVGVLQCLRMLSRHPIVVVAPIGLELPRMLQKLPAERFPEQCFRSVRDYNRLVLSPEFYERFDAYDYILIHQLDAFVFRDELMQWCHQGFDYIGAPWMGVQFPRSQEWDALLAAHTPPGAVEKWRNKTLVGNGGFSLRKVRTMKRILETYPLLLRTWGDRHEDGFWGIAARLCLPESDYCLPSAEEAMAFAFETRPEECMNKLGRLPFGCHAWNKIAPAFWKPWIQEAGFRLHVPGDGGWQDHVAAWLRKWKVPVLHLNRD